MVSSTHQTLSKNRRRRSRIRTNSHHLKPPPTKKKGPKSYKDNADIEMGLFEDISGTNQAERQPSARILASYLADGADDTAVSVSAPEEESRGATPEATAPLKTIGPESESTSTNRGQDSRYHSVQSGGGDEDNGEYENGRGLGRGGDREGRSTVIYSSRERRSYLS